MAYKRVNWENLPSKNTPVNADNLNKMDKGIANAVEKTGDTMTGALILKKTSMNYNRGAIPGTREAVAHTIEDLINELRYTNGQIGSVEIKTAYTLNNITISTGWYNYSYIPHRIGGRDGGANGDNTNFGTLMLTGMNISSPIYVLQYNNGVIQELTSLATTNVTKNLQTQINNMFNSIYPVGSVYISVNSTNPSNLFGGTWVQLQGRFLIGVGSATDVNNETRTISNGQTGGEWVHKLTIAEMPSHNHTWGWRKSAASGNNAWDSAGSDRTGTSSDIIGNTGGGQPHNNMPPYLGVYMWKRTK